MPFQLDTSIPGRGSQGSSFNPLQTLSGLMALRAQRDEGEYRRQLLASNRDTMLRKQRDDAEQATVESAYDTAGGDREKTLATLPPHLRPKVLAVFAKADEAQTLIDQHTATLAKTNEDLAKAQTARNAAWAWGIHQAGNTPQALQYAINELAQKDPQAAIKAQMRFGPSPTPEQIATFTNYTMNQDPDMVKQLEGAAEENRKKDEAKHKAKMAPFEEAKASADATIALSQVANMTKGGLLPAEAAADKRATDAAAETKRYHDLLLQNRDANGDLTVSGRNIAIRHRSDQLAALDRLVADQKFLPESMRTPQADIEKQRKTIEDDYQAQLAPLTGGRRSVTTTTESEPAPEAPLPGPGPRRTPDFPGAGTLGALTAPQAPFQYRPSAPTPAAPAPSLDDLRAQMTRLASQFAVAAPARKKALQDEYARLRQQYTAAGGR